jgi:protein involved in polysaccharide export with SLBB domain
LAALGTARAEAALHPGDKVNVTVYNHPELSSTPTVDAAGNVALPVAGTISALNLEPEQLAERIRARLAPYVRKVAVDVRLDVQTASVFVAGGPVGVLKYQPGETLTNVVDQLAASVPLRPLDAQGAQAVAAHDVVTSGLDLVNGPIDFHRVRILREGRVLGPFDVLALRSSAETGPSLAPNDTIQLVHKPVAVAVGGDVERPGTAYLDANEPLSEALNQVGGLAASSSQAAIVLDRGGVRKTVSIGNPEFSQPAQDGDRLIVPRAPRVDVLGNVAKPGETLLRGDPTLVSAIYYAGGPAQYANLRSVVLMRNGQRTTYDLGKIQKGGTGNNPTLQDGDVVLVPQGSKFQWSDVWSALGALGLFGVHI